MSKKSAVLFEPLPYYMSAMGMQGARFIVGDPNGGVPDPDPDVDPAPPADPDPTPDPKPEPADELGEGGKKALESERTARKQAEKDKADAESKLDTVTSEKDTEIETLKGSITEKEQALAGKDQTIAERENEISVLKLAIANGLTNAEDVDLLMSISDEAKRKSAAERLSNVPGVSRKSGLPGPDGAGSGGSLAAGQDLYNKRHNKQTS